MNSKKKTYILLIAVFLVWGLIVYRIYNVVNPTIPKVEINNTTTSFKPYKIAKKDAFSIKADYRDPFLEKYANKTNRSNRSNTKTSSTKKVTKKEEKVIFPRIAYKGIISPKSRLDKHFILKINNKTVLFKLLETHKEIQLLQGDSKEIVVFYKGEQKKIALK